MKKRILLIMLIIVSVFLLVGCATTKATDVFRFEVRELKLTLYGDSEKNKDKELKLIRGDTDKNATIVYTASYIDGEKAGTVDMNNGIIEIKGSGTNDLGYATTTGVDDNIKIVPVGEGTIRFTAYVQGKENVVDSIIVTVQKEILSAFTLKAVYDSIYVTETTSFKTSTIPTYLDGSVLRYEVSDEKVASITADGTLKGLTPGEVTVKAYSKYDPSLYAIAKVKVTYADAASVVVLDENEFEIEDEIVFTNGDTKVVSTVVEARGSGLTSDSVSQKVTFKSGDNNILKVTTNEDGTVTLTAASGGETTLTVQSEDKKATTTLDIIVNWPQTETLELVSENLEVAVKKNVSVERTAVVPANANPKLKLTVKEGSEELISISGEKIEGLKPGDAYVIVSTIESGTNVPIEKEVKVVVSYDTLTSINLQSKEIGIVTGDSKFVEGVYSVNLRWTLVPAGSNPQVTLTSSDETVAKISEEGVLTIYDKVGTATITITSNANPEIKAECVVSVAAKPVDFSVEGPEDLTEFVYSEDLEVVFTVTILPEDALQDAFEVEIDNKDNCFVDYEVEGNKIKLIFDPDSLGEFDLIVYVDGISKEWFRTYTIKAAENND